MINTIIDVIKSDNEIISLLSPTISNPKIYNTSTIYIGDCIIYNYINLIDDGIRVQDRLEITACSKDEDKAREIIDRVKQLIITVADSQKVNGILEITQNGGGKLFDEDTKLSKLKAYFTIKAKSKITL